MAGGCYRLKKIRNFLFFNIFFQIFFPRATCRALQLVSNTIYTKHSRQKIEFNLHIVFILFVFFLRCKLSFILSDFYVFLYKTRLLGRFAPIFYLNCEHDLFVYILKQRRKKFCGFKKINLRMSRDVPQKICARLVQPF